MFIDAIHVFLKFLKNQGQSRYHSPEEITAAINRAALDLFRQEEKIFESTQIITDTLGAFKERNIYALLGPGIYALPADYIRTTLLTYNSDLVPSVPIITLEEPFTYCDPDFVATPSGNAPLSDKEVEIALLVDSEWASRQSSVIVPPSVKDPIGRIDGTDLEILPTTIAPILYYLRKPVKGVWAYTTSVDGHTPIFDIGGSTDLDWPEFSHNEIIEKTMSFLGIPLRDGMLAQFEQLQKANNNER